MNKRLVWNFEINANNPLQFPRTESPVQGQNRWESRFFWPADQIITLHGLNDNFLELSRYQVKHKQDTYYLIPDADYNLKIRHEQLFYKPLLIKKPQAMGYGKKIILEEHVPSLQLPGCEEKDVAALVTRINHQGIKIKVEKEALIYQFETTPITKLELACLHVASQTYFSASIESRSLLLVESIAKQLLGDLITSDYVTFLRGILK